MDHVISICCQSYVVMVQLLSFVFDVLGGCKGPESLAFLLDKSKYISLHPVLF